MPLYKHSTHFETPGDVEPRRATNVIQIGPLAPLPPPEPSGQRIKISEFKYFPKLPTELREMIIKLANQKRRCITIRKRVIVNNYDLFHKLGDPYGDHLRSNVTAGATVPAFLHVDKEARSISLEAYELCFGGLLTAGPIYFNFSLDSLHFPTTEDGQTFLGARHILSSPNIRTCKCLPVTQSARDEFLGKLRYMAVGDWTCRKPNSIPFTFDLFENLETLTLGWCQQDIATPRHVLQASFGRKWDSKAKKPEIIYLDTNQLAEVTKAADPPRKKFVIGNRGVIMGGGGTQTRKSRVERARMAAVDGTNKTSGTEADPIILE